MIIIIRQSSIDRFFQIFFRNFFFNIHINFWNFDCFFKRQISDSRIQTAVFQEAVKIYWDFSNRHSYQKLLIYCFSVWIIIINGKCIISWIHHILYNWFKIQIISQLRFNCSSCKFVNWFSFHSDFFWNLPITTCNN